MPFFNGILNEDVNMLQQPGLEHKGGDKAYVA